MVKNPVDRDSLQVFVHLLGRRGPSELIHSRHARTAIRPPRETALLKCMVLCPDLGACSHVSSNHQRTCSQQQQCHRNQAPL